MKKLLIFSIFLFIISLVVGYMFSLYIKNEAKDKSGISINNIALSNEVVESTSNEADEIKLSHNAKLYMKKYYTVCNHVEVMEVELPYEMINKTKKEIASKYPEWKIETFFKDSITLSKSIEDVCNEHFLVKLDDNSVDVYKMNNNKEYLLYKDTNITSDYLAETDVELLEDGIYVYGITKLNSILEDFE